MSRPERTVITGAGPVTPVGTGRSDLDAAMRGEIPLPLFSPDEEVRLVPARTDESGRVEEIGGWRVADILGTPRLRQIRSIGSGAGGRSLFLAVLAARLAVADAGLDLAREDRTRIGVMVGATNGDERLLAEVDSFNLWTTPYLSTVAATGLVSLEFGLRGPAASVSAACATGLLAVAAASGKIRAGRADVMLAGATWSPPPRRERRGIAPAPDDRSRGPFDSRRAGTPISEGAALLVLESEAHADARGARILARISGYGEACEPGASLADTVSEGFARAMRQAIGSAEETLAGILEGGLVIAANGTATPRNDAQEAHAIREVLGSAAPRVPVTGPKGRLGNAQAAGGAIQVSTLLTPLVDGYVLPTAGLVAPDPAFADLLLVAGSPRPFPHEWVLVNGAGFSSIYASLLLRRPRPPGS